MSANLPLAGMKIVVTRTPEQAEPWLRRLKALGAEARNLPMIELAACAPDALDAALDRIATYDWLAFTSANAVRFTVRRIRERGESPRALVATTQVAALGDATREALTAADVPTVVVGDKADGHGLADALFRQGKRGKRVLVPAARIGRPELVERLRAAGASVDVVAVYDTLAPRAPDSELLDALRAGTFDVVVLASPSAARNLWNELDGALHERVRVVCIGPTTMSAAQEQGYRVAATAAEPSIDGLVGALLRAPRTAQLGG